MEVLAESLSTVNEGQPQDTNPPAAKWPEPVIEDFNDPDWPSLNGSDEEVRRWVLENKKLMMRVVTWNLCAKPPPNQSKLTEKLLPKKFHVIVFGTEECERSIAQSALLPSKRNWEAYLCEALGETYVPLRAHTLQAIHIMCFVHRSIANLCSVVTSAAVACGAGNTLGNKGAVSVFLKICGTKILVVNAHLSAHQHAERKRNAEFRKISLQMPLLLEQKDGGTTSTSEGSTSVDQQRSSAVVDQSSEAPQIINEGHVPMSPQSMKGAAPSDGAEALPPPLMVPTGNDPATADNGMDEDDEAEADADALDSPSPLPGNGRPLSTNNSFLGGNAAQSSGASTGKTIDKFADIVVFMGDLNYRIKGNRSIVDKLLAADMYEVLLNNDQLRNNMKQKLVLENFVEPPLHFRPTYKFDRGTDIYDSGPKSRIPSWTDRILYKETEHVVCLGYNSDMSISTSDHKPVYASFLVNLNTFVELDANKQVVVSNPTDVKFTSESQVCTIM